MTCVALERARSAPAVDEAVFLQLVADLGAQHIAEVCRVFLENAASGIDAVSRALDAGDARRAADAAHRLKSASGFLGATRLAGLCAAVEAGSDPRDPADALAAELRRTTDDLDVLVERVAGAGP
jgi:HPt (histidine-containing phosphotransfer) domain-containing protein